MVPTRARDKSLSLAEAIQENYSKLLRWASHITRNDFHAAEDLVQNLFVKSLQMEDSLVEIENIESYIYRALRNAHASDKRRRTLQAETSLDEYLLTSRKVPSLDPRTSLLIRDDLVAICHFACARKDSSIAASVLLFKYFHGYFTAEIVRLLKRSRSSIEGRLADARRELDAGLLNDKQPTKRRAGFPPGGSGMPIVSAETLLEELRNYVFSRTTGRCLTYDQYRKLYSKQALVPTREEIGHLVSCRTCLNLVNALLKMPELKERHPLDTRGPKSPSDIFECRRSKFARSCDPDF